MSLVDANVILRYLLDDHAELSPKAADILEHQLSRVGKQPYRLPTHNISKYYDLNQKYVLLS